MFQRILIPLDGSKRAEQAIPVAARLAQASGGSIRLLQIVGETNDWEIYAPGVALMRQTALEAEVTSAKTYLTEVARSSCFEGIEISTAVCAGPVASHILTSAYEQESDLIILCSHGYTGFKRWALGSTAQKIAHSSSIPVLILRGQRESSPGGHEYDRSIRILAALDGSPLAETVLPYAAQLSMILSAPHAGELRLARVIPFSLAFEYGQKDHFALERGQAIQEAQAYLQRAETRLRNDLPLHCSLRVLSSVASSLDTAQSLLDLAEKGMCAGSGTLADTSDIIALTTRGRGGLAHWIMGSIAERLLTSTHLPLLVVHPPQTTVLTSQSKHQASSSEREIHT